MLEICAFNIQSCLIAQQAGASRIELCDNAEDGGTTPSYATIYQARKLLSIPLYPIIRPRGLDFCYNELEWELMKEDIRLCKNVGCDGISIGVQKSDGTIDHQKLSEAVECAYPMGVTCNRVFDAVPNSFDALEKIIDAGCERILTSGLADSAINGANMISKLIEKANNNIIIMPGAGIRSNNIMSLIENTGAQEFHASARIKSISSVSYKNPAIMDAGEYLLCDEKEITSMVKILQIQ